MNDSSDQQKAKTEIIKRLRRIEGQISGIAKMIEKDQNCTDILTQVSAVRGAVNKVGSLVLEKYSYTCIARAASPDERDKAIADLTKTVQSFLNFAS